MKRLRAGIGRPFASSPMPLTGKAKKPYESISRTLIGCLYRDLIEP
jgi:hypothetical protein